MEDSFIAALKSMLTLQRWNLHPKVETWVEAENAAMVTHFAYVIAKDMKLPKKCVTHLLLRSLLQSLSKHFMTDISRFVTNELQVTYPELWKSVTDDWAERTGRLLPRSISPLLKTYLTDNADYGRDRKFLPISKAQVKQIEHIFRVCKLKAAIQECAVNNTVYSNYYTLLNIGICCLKKSKGITHIFIYT